MAKKTFATFSLDWAEIPLCVPPPPPHPPGAPNSGWFQWQGQRLYPEQKGTAI